MSMEEDMQRVEERNTTIKYWLKVLLATIMASLAATLIIMNYIGLILPILFEDQAVTDETRIQYANPFLFITPEGNEILFKDTSDYGYFNEIEFTVLKPGEWYISIVTEQSPSDGKAQLLRGVIEVVENGEQHPFKLFELDEGNSAKFSNIGARVIPILKGVVVVADPLNAAVKQVIFDQIEGDGKMWSLHRIPETNEFVRKEGWTMEVESVEPL